MNKVALGTAQFGMDYGINNKRGKIPEVEVFEILNEAFNYGLDILDTAPSYGDSEKVIGNFIRKQKKEFKIVSKLPKCNLQEVKKIFDSSLKRLNGNKLYGYMFHSFRNYVENPRIWDILKKLKADGKIEKIGFSPYFPSELECLLKNRIKMDIIQIPYNIFDQRFSPYFSELKNNGVEVHVRSVFLNGIVFKNPDELSIYFVKIKEKIKKFKRLSIKVDIPIVALCLNFAILNRFVDYVVVGVDNLENLKEIVLSSDYLADVENILTYFSDFIENDEKIILPFNWEKNNQAIQWK